MKFYEGVRSNKRNKCLNFGADGDLDHYALCGPWILAKKVTSVSLGVVKCIFTPMCSQTPL